jgi:hypothetical protein
MKVRDLSTTQPNHNYSHLRDAIRKYCRGDKTALSPRFRTCLRDIFFHKSGYSSRQWRNQHENICDLRNADYARLRDQTVMKFDRNGKSIHFSDAIQCSDILENVPATNIEIINTAAQYAGATISHAHKILKDIKTLKFIPYKNVRRAVSLFVFITERNHPTIFVVEGIILGLSILPMYDISYNCMDMHGLFPVPARFRFQAGFVVGSIVGIILCTLSVFKNGFGKTAEGIQTFFSNTEVGQSKSLFDHILSQTEKYGEAVQDGESYALQTILYKIIQSSMCSIESFVTYLHSIFNTPHFKFMTEHLDEDTQFAAEVIIGGMPIFMDDDSSHNQFTGDFKRILKGQIKSIVGAMESEETADAEESYDAVIPSLFTRVSRRIPSLANGSPFTILVEGLIENFVCELAVVFYENSQNKQHHKT